MANPGELHTDAAVITALEEEAHHEHPQSFWTKYVFSTDHKMISRQFLITGMIWAIIGAGFSIIFRLQLGFPGEKFPILETILGKWAENGVINHEFYYAMVTMHGTIMIFLC